LAGFKTSTSKHRVCIAEGIQDHNEQIDLFRGPSTIPTLWTTTRKDLHMKKSLLKYSLVVLGLALGTATAAHGMVFGHVPEVDPNLAVSALTLLGGTLAVLRVRRSK
jgi:hypothetical protein